MVVEMCCQCVASTEIHDLNRSHGTRGLEYVGMQWFVDECVRARSMSTEEATSPESDSGHLRSLISLLSRLSCCFGR